MQFLHLPIAGTAGATQAEVTSAWQKIIERLDGAAAYIAAGNALVTNPGHLYGVTGAEQLAGAPSLLGGPLTDAAKAQLPADRFAAFGFVEGCADERQRARDQQRCARSLNRPRQDQLGDGR